MESLGLHLFLGPDRARKLQRIQELERSFRVDTMDRHHLDGAVVKSAELVALCRQRPAVSPARLIVVDQAHRLDLACAEALLQHAQIIAQMSCVVLLVDRELSVRHPLARAAHHGAISMMRFAGGDTPTAKPFALMDALGVRDLPEALRAVRDQLNGGKEPLELLGLVAWQLQRWILVRRLSESGLATPRIAALAGMQAWQVERVRSEISGRPLVWLDQMLTRCWQLDVDAKSGRTLPLLAIEQLVFELAVT